MDYLGEYSFAYCPLLTTFDLSLKEDFYLNRYTFFNSTNFTTIINYESIWYFGIGCFNNFSSLSENYLTLRHHIIDSYLYCNCTSIAQFEILPSIEDIGDYAFAGTKLYNITIPPTIKTIGQEAFENCSNLVSIDIQAPITRLRWYSFANCKSLVEFVVPETVNDVGGYCFANCISLINITLVPLEYIQEGTFYNCNNIPKILSDLEKFIGLKT